MCKYYYLFINVTQSSYITGQGGQINILFLFSVCCNNMPDNWVWWRLWLHMLVLAAEAGGDWAPVSVDWLRLPQRSPETGSTWSGDSHCHTFGKILSEDVWCQQDNPKNGPKIVQEIWLNLKFLAQRKEDNARALVSTISHQHWNQNIVQNHLLLARI